MKTSTDILMDHFEKRKKRNQQYSLRAFAKGLDVSPSQLSQILSGKRKLSIKMAKQIADKLSLSPIEKENFLETLNPNQQTLNSQAINDGGRLLLKEDEFRLICDWEHFAILSLSELKENSFDSRWIARRLGIKISRAAEARDRLLRMGLIERRGHGFIQIAPPVMTTNDILSQSIQKSHLGNLELATERLKHVAIDKREYTSVTLATNPQKIAQAKTMIRNFKRKLTRFLEDSEKSEVYTLSIQLFPNTIIEENS